MNSNNTPSGKKPGSKDEIRANIIEPKDEDILDNGSGFLFDFGAEETSGDADKLNMTKDREKVVVPDKEKTEQEKTLEDVTVTELPDEEVAVIINEQGSEDVPEEAEKTEPSDPTDVVEMALSQDDDNGDKLTLAYFASRAYLEYAISVVKGRALPEVSDGQKPVQRRILYAMKRMGLTADAKQVKSARIVGDVLGKFHPHGDAAAYDAMVRMAQDFTMRYPLVHGVGNFGSQDGDSAAHMRYTEAKLSKYSELLLEEIDSGGIKFIPNYDGAFKEPVSLPSRLPFLLLNGASGIAVGMATEIPPHNLKEVAQAAEAIVKDPAVTLDELMEHLPGPDFPGGGQIISPQKDIVNAYKTGYGSLLLRASYEFEELSRGQWQLVITELPYKVGAAKVLAEIEALTNPKPSQGKKTLTAKQQQDKALLLGLLDRARDESDTEHAVRIVLEPKSKLVNRDEFINVLFAKTSLECSCKFNLVAIGIDGKPRQKGLVEILSEWAVYRLRTVLNRSKAKLEVVQNRIHVLEGRLLIVLNIEEVIRIIREAKDPKAALIKAYGLTEAQAEDILELKLRQLANLDEIKLNKDIDALRKEESGLLDVINNESKLRNLVCREIRNDAKRFGDDRRTLIEEARTATFTKKVADEPITVIVSAKGFVRARAGHDCDVSAMSFKLGDELYDFFRCRTIDNLIVLSDSGRVYSVPVSMLPTGRGDGTHISAFVQFQDKDKPISYIAGSNNTSVLMASSGGYGFLCKIGDMVSKQKGGKTFFVLDEQEGKPFGFRPFSVMQTLVAVLTVAGRFLAFDIKELRALPSGGRGVSLISLEEGDSVAAVLPCTINGVIACGLGRGNKEQTYSIGPRLIESYRAKRARKGRLLPNHWQYYDLIPAKQDEKFGLPGTEEKSEPLSKENTEKHLFPAEPSSPREAVSKSETESEVTEEDFEMLSDEEGSTGLLF